MEDFKWDNYQTLITVPATDCNFKAALKSATDDELSRAKQHMTDKPFANKTRLKTVQQEIRKRAKS
jgi:hypothetical protein